MKFGKRLAAEAARRWRPYYLDYKACKRAIQQDVHANDPRGRNFEAVLRHELAKISAFYADKEAELEALMASVERCPPAGLGALRAEVADLRKYAALNYVAVIKAVKKRNRHLGAAVGSRQLRPLRALDLLSTQHFYTSPKLAALATQAELLSQGLEAQAGPGADDELRGEYGCPICLGLLHNPVVLTCAHRFCWGCLLAHCATALRTRSKEVVISKNEAGNEKQHAAAMVQPFEDSATPTVATYDCPVCRKAHVLDLDRLQVDPHLDRFMVDLQQRVAAADAASGRQRGSGSLTETLAAAQQQHPTTLSFTCRPIGPHAVSEGAASPPGSSPEASGQQPGTEVHAVLLETSAATSPPIACPKGAPPQKQAVLVEASKLPDLAGGLLASALAEDSARAVAAGMDTAESMEADEEPPLLPPQSKAHAGRLTVVLDLDGTLLSSFTPRRAPALPPGSVSYIVGRGGRLNPNGVFVVERPGLKTFLHRLSEFAEVVLFTAGLEDYAKPILDELDRRYGAPLVHRLYRPATTTCSAYPCLKDLSRLGRDLRRTVLVDDTPLAFLRQPDNGIPIFNFRGDVDDRVLCEAMLPLLQALASAPDVRPVLHRRFDMPRWFMSQGVAMSPAPAKPANVKRRLSLVTRPAASLQPPASVQPPSSADLLSAQRRSASRALLLCDFDKTLTDWDAGERLVEELAPELAPMLASLAMPANFVPMTNAVLGEMARRGVSRDRILATLRAMGSELPAGTAKMLQWAARAGIDVRILSDCNSLFISHILTGAKVNTLVKEVITNTTSFERVSGGDPSELANGHAPDQAPCIGASPQDGGVMMGNGSAKPAAHRLQVHPRFPYDAGHSHGCRLCPANLCKGQELEALRRAQPYQKIVYCGDGANDLCPALSLTPSDIVLARKGHALAQMIAERAGGADEDSKVVARVLLWEDHAQLCALAQSVLA